MTNHSTALRETSQTTYLGSKDDRRSPFFSPPKKLSKVFAKSTSLDSLPPGPSSRPSGRPSTASSAETSTTSPRLSPTPVQAGQKKSKSSKVTSPRVVSSILNGMYAYPTNPQVGSFLPRATRRTLSASPLLNNIPDVSKTICESNTFLCCLPLFSLFGSPENIFGDEVPVFSRFGWRTLKSGQRGYRQNS